MRVELSAPVMPKGRSHRFFDKRGRRQHGDIPPAVLVILPATFPQDSQGECPHISGVGDGQKRSVLGSLPYRMWGTVSRGPSVTHLVRWLAVGWVSLGGWAQSGKVNIRHLDALLNPAKLHFASLDPRLRQALESREALP